MQLTHTITKKITCLSVCTLLLLLCSGCASKDGQQDTAILDEAFEDAAEAKIEKGTIEKGTIEKIDRNNTTKTDELQYPILLTPTRTKNIAFAVESEDIFCICDGEKYGYLKKTGEEITDYTYDMAYPFSEGLACVMVDGKYGFINENGGEAIPFIYEDAAPFQDGLAYFATEEGYGFMDKDGIPVFYLDCDSVSSFQEGLAYFSIDGRYGYLDKTGKVVIDAEYSDAGYFKDGLAFVEIDGYKGAVNAKGKIVIPVQYDSISRDNEYIFAVSGDETEYYSLTGDAIPQEVYANQVNAVDEDEEYTHLQEKLGAIYDYVGYFQNGRAEVLKGGYFGIVDEDGNLIVPVEYDLIELFEDGSYCLKEGEDTFLYNSEQELIYENHGVDGTAYISWLEYGYKIEEDDTIFLIDKGGKEIVSVACDYASHDIYSDYKNSILKQYDSDTPDRILILEENEAADISDVLLKNSITPRIDLYWKLTHGKPIDILNTEKEVVNVKKFGTWGESDYRKTAKLYDVLQNGMPLLYCMEEPAIQHIFPLSYSALYDIKDNQLQCLVSGEECGGSLRGDYVCFFKDMETGDILIGNQGSAGGFGGSATYSRIYDYEVGNANLIFYYGWVSQSIGNYTEEYLYNNAHLFYDDNDNPYTQDTVMNDGYVNEYSVNDELVSPEEYENACKQYRCFTLFE